MISIDSSTMSDLLTCVLHCVLRSCMSGGNTHQTNYFAITYANVYASLMDLIFLSINFHCFSNILIHSMMEFSS